MKDIQRYLKKKRMKMLLKILLRLLIPIAILIAFKIIKKKIKKAIPEHEKALFLNGFRAEISSTCFAESIIESAEIDICLYRLKQL